jgi:hypothetical protein
MHSLCRFDSGRYDTRLRNRCIFPIVGVGRSGMPYSEPLGQQGTLKYSQRFRADLIPNWPQCILETSIESRLAPS